MAKVKIVTDVLKKLLAKGKSAARRPPRRSRATGEITAEEALAAIKGGRFPSGGVTGKVTAEEALAAIRGGRLPPGGVTGEITPEEVLTAIRGGRIPLDEGKRILNAIKKTARKAQGGVLSLGGKSGILNFLGSKAAIAPGIGLGVSGAMLASEVSGRRGRAQSEAAIYDASGLSTWDLLKDRQDLELLAEREGRLARNDPEAYAALWRMLQGRQEEQLATGEFAVGGPATRPVTRQDMQLALSQIT